MKIVRYKFLSTVVNRGTKKEPKMEKIFVSKELGIKNDEQFEAALPFIENEAYEGKYTVEEVSNENAEPTQEERITELEEAFRLLLSGEVLAVLEKYGVKVDA